MRQSSRTARLTRWGVPAGAVATAGLVAAVTAASSAQAVPQLAPRTPQQLLASVARAANAAPRPLSGTISESTALGLPSLPDLGGVSSSLSALTGSHTFKVWYADPAHVRVADIASMGETDLRVDGRQVWLWQSSSQTATRLTLPARSAEARAKAGAAGRDAAAAVTPQQAARKVLAAVGPSTVVGVQQNVTVAGQAAYQLRIAPRSSQSLVGRILIAVDAANSTPLRLEVFARGASSPAIQIGFTSISWGKPAASNFTFSPPNGAKVKHETLAAAGGFGLGGPFAVALPAARNWTQAGVQVKVPAGAKMARINARFAQHRLPPGVQAIKVGNRRLVVPKGLPKAAVAKLKAALKSGKPVLPILFRSVHGRAQVSLRKMPKGFTAPVPVPVPFPALAAGPRVIGKGWLSVVVFPAMAAMNWVASPPGPLPRGSATYGGSAGVTPQRVVARPAGALGGLGQYLPLLEKSATPVHGAFGSGRLLRTALVSVLITSKGQVLAGAVTPSVLYAAAAQVK